MDFNWEFRFNEAKLRIFGDMLSYLSRLVPAELLEVYSYHCTRRSDARLLSLTPGAVLQQCKVAPFKFWPPPHHYNNKKTSPSKFRGQLGTNMKRQIRIFGIIPIGLKRGQNRPVRKNVNLFGRERCFLFVFHHVICCGSV